MAFWAYMLHCRGGYLYVGHTDDLEARVNQHKHGHVAGFAADHLPVELVWSEEFATRLEALEAERRLKGWGRPKKLALVRGDRADVSRLARKKGSASTSSARTGWVAKSLLHPHPMSPPAAIESVLVSGSITTECATLDFSVGGERPAMPALARSERTDGLWQRTCFELFVRPEGGEAYFEFNFSPSTAWAAYRFDGYRDGMADLPLATPRIERRDDGVRVGVDLTMLPPPPWRVGLSTVVEETGGTKSYWALAHPSGKPDFHHPDCFALHIPAAA